MATLVSSSKRDVKRFNYCDYIISQIERNCKRNNSNSSWVDDKNCYLVLRTGKNPERMSGAINLLTAQKAFKVLTIKEVEFDGKKSTYEISYKDLNFDAPSIKHLKKYDKSVNRLEYNDEFRFEECKSMSSNGTSQYDLLDIKPKKLSDRDFEELMQFLNVLPDENLARIVEERQAYGKYEQLDRNDDCCFDLFVKQRGFQNLTDFYNYCQLEDISSEELDALYREFIETGKANPWELGEDAEIDEELALY